MAQTKMIGARRILTIALGGLVTAATISLWGCGGSESSRSASGTRTRPSSPRAATDNRARDSVAADQTKETSEGTGWGSLRGRFVVDGVPPESRPLVVSGDEFCIGQQPMDETVVTGEEGRLANVLVYIWPGRRGQIEVHPDYADQLEKPVQLDNKACHFVPHVTLLRTGQPLILKNSDPVGHNTNLAGIFNEIIASGDERPKDVGRAAAQPISVNCNIHAFMKGYVLVQDHPYMAVSGEDGTFEIKNIPAGEREFTFWHEAPEYMRDLKVGGGTTDRRGRVNLTIKNGETLNLGDILVPVALLRASR